MADRSILYRLRAALQGGFTTVASESQLLGTFSGVVSGAANAETGLQRLDGTGVGAPIFTVTSSYTAQASNINEWFGGRQQTRIRFTDDGPLIPPTFTLPGATALGTAFDQLVAAGLPEMIIFILEYTGPSASTLNIVPRNSDPGTPQIQGVSRILVASGIGATVEITRTSGVISDYLFTSIGGIGNTGGSALDSIKLINPATAVWDASTNGSLPDANSVVKGNAYQVVNAPSDGSGRFGEVMQNGDRVLVEAETFTSWTATTPRQWSVVPLHEVRRITALEQDFLNTFATTPESNRNTIIRGANYADSAGEIRLKLYAAQNDYSAADLNTTGDIDEFTDGSDANSYLAIRLSGTRATLSSTLPTLYVYSEDSNGNFTRLLNLQDDFAYQGDFGSESDYLSNEQIAYNANDTLRIYVTSVEDRYNSPDLDVTEENLSPEVQAKLNRSDPSGSTDQARLASLETKVNALFPLTPDVTDLVGWGDIYNTENATQSVNITDGYSLIADYRGASTKYESTGVTYSDSGTNVVTYTGLGDDLFRTFGFKVGGPADQVLMWIVDGTERIPFVDMTSGGNYRINNYTPATTEDRAVVNQFGQPLTAFGQSTLRAGTTDTATYTMRNYPANATSASRTMQIDTDILLNGSDTQAGHFQDIDIPDTNVAQGPSTFNASVYLGPLYQNRTVNLTLSYETRVSGSDMLVDIKLVSAPSDVTVRMNDVFTILSYTAPADVARVDNFVVLNDGASNYTFTGENELLVTFHPFEDQGFMNAVPVAIDSAGTVDELNDANVPIPNNHFGSVEIPDTTALTDFEFRTFAPEHFLNHSDLAHLLSRRATQWCYGLAELRAVSEHAVSEAVDFTQGVVLQSPDNSRWTVSVANDGTLKTDPA